MAKKRAIFFRIFYSTSFTAFFILLICVICVAPADAYYDSYRKSRIIDIFILAGAYILTGLLALLLYASRLYNNRSVLRDIPKSYLPIEEDDLPEKKIRRLIEQFLARNAIIAHQAKPRSFRIEDELPIARETVLKFCGPGGENQNKEEPRWGQVIHPGWASPESKDLPNLHYSTVVGELTDLIEAKAFNLAPIDPAGEPQPDGTTMPSEKVINVLTRPDAAGMRQYLSHLIQLGIVPDTSLPTTFLAAYERARFSKTPMTAVQFRELMKLFAELLRSMTPLETEVLDLIEFEENDSPVEEAVDNNELPDPYRADQISDSKEKQAITGHLYNPAIDHLRESSGSEESLVKPHLPRDDHTRVQNLYPLASHSEPTLKLATQSQITFSSPLALPPLTRRITTHSSSDGDNDLSPTQTRSEKGGPENTSTNNAGSGSRTLMRRTTTATTFMSSSSSSSGSRSMRSARSNRSETGSVIRLATPEDGHDLPYTIPFPRLPSR